MRGSFFLLIPSPFPGNAQVKSRCSGPEVQNCLEIDRSKQFANLREDSTNFKLNRDFFKSSFLGGSEIIVLRSSRLRFLENTQWGSTRVLKIKYLQNQKKGLTLSVFDQYSDQEKCEHVQGPDSKSSSNDSYFY